MTTHYQPHSLSVKSLSGCQTGWWLLTQPMRYWPQTSKQVSRMLSSLKRWLIILFVRVGGSPQPRKTCWPQHMRCTKKKVHSRYEIRLPIFLPISRLYETHLKEKTFRWNNPGEKSIKINKILRTLFRVFRSQYNNSKFAKYGIYDSLEILVKHTFHN